MASRRANSCSRRENSTSFCRCASSRSMCSSAFRRCASSLSLCASSFCRCSLSICASLPCSVPPCKPAPLGESGGGGDCANSPRRELPPAQLVSCRLLEASGLAGAESMAAAAPAGTVGDPLSAAPRTCVTCLRTSSWLMTDLVFRGTLGCGFFARAAFEWTASEATWLRWAKAGRSVSLGPEAWLSRLR